MGMNVGVVVVVGVINAWNVVVGVGDAPVTGEPSSPLFVVCA